MYYRHKPTLVEAYRFVDSARPPSWVRNAFNDGVAAYEGGFQACILVDTNHGTVKAHSGDWLVKSPAGEIYPITDEVFHSSYEPIVEDEAA